MVEEHALAVANVQGYNQPKTRDLNLELLKIITMLLIVAHTMRQWPWKDTLDNVGHYGKLFYPVVCVVIVFAVCTVIDIISIHLLEKPFLKWWDKHWDGFYKSYKMEEEKIFQKLHID